MLTRKNIWNALFFAFLFAILLIPSAKAIVIQGLMQIGLFKPNITAKTTPNSAAITGVKFKASNGTVINLEDLKGKIVFINFWATWCPPCLAEMPSINKFYEQFKTDKDIVVIMVDADNNFEKALKYMARKKYKLPVYNMASKVPQNLFAGSLPTTVVLNKEGAIVYNGVGAANYADAKFIAMINKLKN